MASTFFTDYQTQIVAAWLNDVNNATYSFYNAQGTTYGAKGNNTVNDQPAIQAALNAAGAAGGGVVLIPPGTYKMSSGTDLVVPVNVHLFGLNYMVTNLLFSNTGNCVVMSAQLNNSTAAHNKIRGINFNNQNLSSTGGVIVNVGGSFVDIEDCLIQGGLYGVVFDQTELASIDRNYFLGQLSGGGSVWLVDGGDHSPAVTFTGGLAASATGGTLTGGWTGATGTYNLMFTETSAGGYEYRSATLTHSSTTVTWGIPLVNACNATTTAASTGYTNRVSITRNQFLSPSGVYGIIDDGGSVHTIADNNFQSGVQAIRCCAPGPIAIKSNEFEGQTGPMITFQSTTLAGTSLGANAAGPVTISENTFIPTASQNAIQFISAGRATLIANAFSSTYSAAASVAITSLIFLDSRGNEDVNPYSGTATFDFRADAYTSAQAVCQRGMSFANGGAASSGTVSTTVLNDYEVGTFTPALSATGNTFNYATQVGTYTRVGNFIWGNIRIQLAASGNTLANHPVTITGLPFASNNSDTYVMGPVVWSAFTSSFVSVTAQLAPSAATLTLFVLSAAGTSSVATTLAGTDLHATNQSIIQIAFSYQI